MNKIYLITYSPTPPFDPGIVHNHITSLYNQHKISDWWHYVDSTYLVATNLNVNDLYKLVFPVVPKRHLLIVEITRNNAQGWLPMAAWTWIQKYFGPKID